MLYHEREGKNKENASFVHIVYLLAKLCNISDEAFFIDVSIYIYIYIYIHRGNLLFLGEYQILFHRVS